MKTPMSTLREFLAAIVLIALAIPAPAATTINVNFGNDAGDAMHGKSFNHDSGNGSFQQAPASYTGTTWNDYLRA